MRVYKYTKKNKQWTQFDNLVLTMDKVVLADGAKVLYGFLAGYSANGKNMTVPYIKKCLGLGQSTYEKYIRQLKKLDLIVVNRVGPKLYDCYVGTTTTPASKVKEYWKELTEDDSQGPLTVADLQLIRGLEVEDDRD